MRRATCHTLRSVIFSLDFSHHVLASFTRPIFQFFFSIRFHTTRHKFLYFPIAIFIEHFTAFTPFFVEALDHYISRAVLYEDILPLAAEVRSEGIIEQVERHAHHWQRCGHLEVHGL